MDGTAGAAFVGMSGTCKPHQTFKTYGYFDALPDSDPTIIGSIGNKKFRRTMGGGRIIINADSFMGSQNTSLLADGLPLKGTNQTGKLAGGSGGYIAVITSNKVYTNSVDNGAKISAVGGHGIKNGGGGGGGIIVIDGDWDNSKDMFDASGGLSDFRQNKTDYNGCANGAPGTVWLKSEDILIVDNKDKITNKFTRILAPTHHTRKLDSPHLIATTFVLKGRA